MTAENFAYEICTRRRPSARKEVWAFAVRADGRGSTWSQRRNWL